MRLHSVIRGKVATIGVSVGPAGVVCQVAEDAVAVNGGEAILKSQRELVCGRWAHPLSLHHQFFFTFEQDGWSVWDMEKLALAEQITTEPTGCGDVSPWDLLCSAHEKTVVFWDIRQRKPCNCVLAHSMQITSCNFSDNGTYVVTAAQDNVSECTGFISYLQYCRIMSPTMSECITTLSTSKVQHTTYAKFTRDCHHVLISTLGLPLQLWDWAKSENKASYFGSKNDRFYLEPSITYNKELPRSIVTTNDNGQLVTFEFAEPQKLPTVLTLDLPEKKSPIRACVDERAQTQQLVYVWQAGTSDVYAFDYESL